MKGAAPMPKGARTSPAEAPDLDRDQLELILQRIPAGVLLAAAPSGTPFFASGHAEHLLGRPLGEIGASLEQNALSLEGRPYAPGEFPLSRAIHRGETVRDEEILYERPDGEPLALRVNAVPVRSRTGKITAGLIIFTDITDLRRSASVARRSQYELLDFFENAVEGLHWAGPDGTLLWANQAELDLLGYAPEEYLGHNLAEFHVDPGVVEEILTRLKRRETLREYDACLRCKDGTIKHVLINANVLWFEEQFIHTRCFTRDVTERKQLEQQLQRRVDELAEADRRKDEFLAMLGHELRNPLAAVGAAVELLDVCGGDAAVVERAREVITRQVKQMARLTDDLLDVSRITYGRIELRKERVRLTEVVARAVETVRPQFDRSRQELSVALNTGDVVLSADPARLEQILVNLLGNAAKHSGIGSRVQLSGESLPGEAILRVRDSGAGIAPAMLQHIFEPFFRGAGREKADRGGLGLGLTLVKELVGLHGGTVEAFSEGLSRGSEFVVRLPAAAGESMGAPLDDRGRNRASESGRRVLLVDDNEDAAVTLGEILGMLGHEVAVAHSGPKAIEQALQDRPDVVVLDIGMPGMDGYEVAQRLRETGALDGVLVIAMTGYGQEHDRRRALAEGFHHHLVKPVGVEALAALIEGK